MSAPLRRVRQIYDADPAGYHRTGALMTERVLARGRRKVGEMVRGRLLDVGFGTGLSLPFYPVGIEVFGIDASPKMLEFARRVAAHDGRSLKAVVMDAQRMAFADRCFDSVAFNLCLCTIRDPEAAVREALRVVKPGAPMVFLEHVRSHLLPVALLQEALNPILVALHEDHWNRRTVEVIRRAGVKVDSVDRWLLGVFNMIAGHAPQ